MASEKISQLSAITSVASGDYFPIVTAATTENKRVDIAVLDERYEPALASGNAALEEAATALASGNAALVYADTKYAISGGLVDGPMSTVVTSLGLNNLNFDFASGNYFNGVISGNITGTFTNVPSESFAFTYKFISFTGSLTWPSGVGFENNTPPSFSADTVNILVFTTENGGSNWEVTTALGFPL